MHVRMEFFRMYRRAPIMPLLLILRFDPALGRWVPCPEQLQVLLVKRRLLCSVNSGLPKVKNVRSKLLGVQRTSQELFYLIKI